MKGLGKKFPLWFLFLACPLFAQDPGSLSLADAVREALEKSPAVAQARLAVRQAALQEPLFLAELDPLFNTAVLWGRDQAPRAAPGFEGEESQKSLFDLGVSQNTLIGTQARLLWTNTRMANDAPFRVIDPSVDSRLTLEVEQPLLRYFWGRPDKARRSQFRASVRAAQAEAARVEDQVVLATARAYYDLHVAVRGKAIVEQTLADAEKLVSLYAEKRRYGLVEDSDRLQAESLREVQKTELDLARSAETRARFALSALLQRQTEESPGTLAITTPVVAVPLPLNEADAVAGGLRERPDIVAARAQLEAAEWSKRITYLDTLPELSFVGSYGVAGLDDDYRGAWDDLGGFDHPVASAGMTFRTPFAGRREELQRESGEFSLETRRRELEQRTQEALRDARDRWEAAAIARERLAGRRRITALERKKMEAEIINFRQGRSSTDVTIRFRQDLQRAQGLELVAEAEEALALLELARATGRLRGAFR
jgi:outer membrane protein TolC